MNLEDAAAQVDVARAELERTQKVITEVAADESIDRDDVLLVFCERMDIPTLAPTFSVFGVLHGVTLAECDVCCALVSDKEGHALWHRRMQAAIKQAAHVGDLARVATMLLGALVSEMCGLPGLPELPDDAPDDATDNAT